LDLFVTNWGQSNRLLHNEGQGAFSDVTTVPLGNTGNSNGVVWLDYDNDMDLDLCVVNWGLSNQLLRNDDDSFIEVEHALFEVSGNGVGVACADYDADGDQDMYLTRAFEANQLLRNMIGQVNHWLYVRLEGTESNAAAIGARVRIVTGGVAQIREVEGGSGYYCQNSQVVAFGLGSNSVVDTLQITWPRSTYQSTRTVTYTQIYADSLITVTEDPFPSGVENLGEAQPLQFGRVEAYPNPFNPRVTLRFWLPDTRQVRLTVYAADGRVVTELLDNELPGGEHTFSWTGQDSRGQDLPSGVYFYRLVTGEMVTTGKMTLIR